MYSKLHAKNGQYGQINDEEKEKKLNAELISIILRHRALIRYHNMHKYVDGNLYKIGIYCGLSLIFIIIF